MSDSRKRLLPEAMRKISSTLITPVFQPFGTPLVHESRILLFVNGGTTDVNISWDGVNEGFDLLAGACFVLDETSNSVAGNVFVTAAQTQFYIKGTPGTKQISLSTFYAI
jgi:hypothetical protein